MFGTTARLLTKPKLGKNLSVGTNLAPWTISQHICSGGEEEDVAPTAPVRPLLVIRGATMAQRGAEQLSRAGAGRAATSPRRWMQLMHCLMRPSPIQDHIGGGLMPFLHCSDTVVSVGGGCINPKSTRCHFTILLLITCYRPRNTVF